MNPKKTSKANWKKKRNLLILLLLLIAFAVVFIITTYKTSVKPVEIIVQQPAAVTEKEEILLQPPTLADPIEIPVEKNETIKPKLTPKPTPKTVEPIQPIKKEVVVIENKFEPEPLETNDQTVLDAVPIAEERTKKDEGSDNSAIFITVDEMPEFPGGEQSLRKWIASNLKYPQNAIDNKIQGKVYITFVIEKDGDVTNPTIARSVEESLDQEALRLAKMLPKWKPGVHRGEIVRVSYTVPINFQIQ